MTGAMTQGTLSLLWTLLAQGKVAPPELTPSPHLQEPLKALLFLLHGHGKARPQLKFPFALSRFLNRYPWPTRTLIRLVRKEAQEALDRARRRKAPSPASWWSWTWSPWGSGAAFRPCPSPCPR